MKEDIKATKHSPIEIFNIGEGVRTQQYKDREEEKKGDLRCGNASMLYPDGQVVGGCPFKTLARCLGYQKPTTGANNYFTGGIENEMTWEERLQLAEVDYRAEEDIPVVQYLETGRKITGRPDIVIGHTVDVMGSSCFKPEVVLELKSLQATKSASRKLLLHEPDAGHLIQAATYSMFMEIPSVLVYTSNVSGGINDYYTERSLDGRKDVGFGKVQFPIGWDKGFMYYNFGHRRVTTSVTQEGILNYYRLIDEMATEQRLAPVKLKSDQDIYGNRANFDPNKWNSFTLACETNEFSEWIDQVKRYCSTDIDIKYEKKTPFSKTRLYRLVRPVLVETDYESYIDKEVLGEYATLKSARRALYNDFV